MKWCAHGVTYISVGSWSHVLSPGFQIVSPASWILAAYSRTRQASSSVAAGRRCPGRAHLRWSGLEGRKQTFFVVHVEMHLFSPAYLAGASIKKHGTTNVWPWYESEGLRFECPFWLQNFDTFTRTSVCVPEMNVVARAQLAFQMLTLLQNYLYWQSQYSKTWDSKCLALIAQMVLKSIRHESEGWGFVPFRTPTSGRDIQKLWHFHKNIRSCIENECSSCTVCISNVNFASKIYLGYLLGSLWHHGGVVVSQITDHSTVHSTVCLG